MVVQSYNEILLSNKQERTEPHNPVDAYQKHLLIEKNQTAPLKEHTVI